MAPSRFRLRPRASHLPHWAARYNEASPVRDFEDRIEQEIAPRIKRLGYLTEPDFVHLARWKSPRPMRHCQANTERILREVTEIAFTTQEERLRIGVLTLLRGVSWPMASVTPAKP